MTTITKQELQEFIKNVFGDKYEIRTDFEKARIDEKIRLYCKKHDVVFKQEISSLLGGKGCPICNDDKRLEALIYELKQKYGDQFDETMISLETTVLTKNPTGKLKSCRLNILD